mgnify:FL=1
MKIRILLLFIIFNLNIHALSVADQLNNFFQYELNFVQKSLNKKNNSIDESTGVLKRNIDNTIQIEIFKPYGESYLINEHEIKIHDLEFNQTRNISLKELENNFFLDFIINGIPNNYEHISIVEDGKYILTKESLEIAIDFINKDTLQLKYKDNMGIDNLIRFSRKS